MKTATKSCFKCGQERAISEFYKHPRMSDGTLNKCKECTKIDSRDTRRKRSEYYREYDRNRGNRLPKGYSKSWREKNPEKYKAHSKVNSAVKSGKLRKENCFMCGSEKTEAHHVDYSKPLDVIWLCSGCHRKQHAYEDRVSQIMRGDAA